MLKVGVIDHHLNNFHADTFLKLLRGPLAGEGVELAAAYESHPTGADWCAKNGVKRVEKPEDAVKGMDAIMVLAPDNIEDHLSLSAAPLLSGKPVFIDKYLATTVAEAERILERARNHETPLFSSSSLRYAVEIEDAAKALGEKRPEEGRFTGMGKWGGYGVHTLSMAMRLMGHDVKRLIHTGTPNAATVTLDYGGNRRALVDVRNADDNYAAFPWTFSVTSGGKATNGKVEKFDLFYENLMRQAVAFFKTGKADMSVEAALAVVKILEGAEQSLKEGGKWVSL